MAVHVLVNKVKKTVIFLPPRGAADHDSPEMTSMVVDNPNSIFIIEDAKETNQIQRRKWSIEYFDAP